MYNKGTAWFVIFIFRKQGRAVWDMWDDAADTALLDICFCGLINSMLTKADQLSVKLCISAKWISKETPHAVL